jgi:PAS domain-containing protein
MTPEDVEPQRSDLSDLLDGLGAAGMLIFEVDLVTGLIVVAATIEALFGVSAGAFSGRYDAFLHLVHPDDRVTLDLPALRAATPGTFLESDFRAVLRTGGQRHFQRRCIVVANSAGQPTTAFGLVVNVGARDESGETAEFCWT